jgi:hypothetical protein
MEALVLRLIGMQRFDWKVVAFCSIDSISGNVVDP